MDNKEMDNVIDLLSSGDGCLITMNNEGVSVYSSLEDSQFVVIMASVLAKVCGCDPKEFVQFVTDKIAEQIEECDSKISDLDKIADYLISQMPGTPEEKAKLRGIVMSDSEEDCSGEMGELIHKMFSHE